MDPVEPPLIHGVGTALSAWQNDATLTHLKALQIDQWPLDARLVIVAPHPDDEILGCAGLIQQCDQRGHAIVIVAVTDGEASHPDSKLYSAQQLAALRIEESHRAWQQLKLKQPLQRIALGLNDGQLNKQQHQLLCGLAAHLQPNDILVSTFSSDGHPDHNACGAVTQQLAQQHQLACWHVLIWTWHWAQPQDPRVPWQRAQRLDLEPLQLQRKAEAAACFHTQLQPDHTTGQAAILSPHTLQRLLQTWEVYLYAN